MAFRTQKISQMTPKGSDLEATDLIEVSTIESGSYVTRSITGQELIDAIPAPSVDWGDIGGTLSDQTDLNTALSGKVPTSRTLTINGTTQDLSADRTFTISTGITIGTTAITSGTVGRVLFQGTGNVVSQSANLFWDDAANRLIIGGSTASNVRANINEFNVQANGLTVPTNGNQLMFNLVGSGQGMSITNQNGTTYRIGQFAVANVLTLGVAGNSTLNLFTSGNIGIGTTTDAGFKLDVNGTARFNGNLTFQTTSWILDNSNAIMHRGGFNVESIAFNLSRMVFTDNNGFVFNGSNSGATLTASSIVDIQSTTKGFLPPRMTTTQKNAIASPAAGLVVYDSTLNKLCVRTASAWETITSL